MLPIAGEKLPESAPQLSAAITEGLARISVKPRDVRVESGVWPHLRSLHVDLTDAHFTRSHRPPKATGAADVAMDVEHLEISGNPAYAEEAPIHLAVNARNVKLGIAPVGDGLSILTARGLESGHFEAKASRANLERLIETLAREGAAQRGVEVKSVQLHVESRNPRTLSLKIEISAKAFIMSTTLTVTGDLAVDDELQIRFSNLHCQGDGVMAGMAASMIEPKLKSLEQRVYSLSALDLSGVRIRDVAVSAGDTLGVRADFAAS